MDMSPYRALFLAEAREHLTTMNDQAIALEQQRSDSATLNALFREAHSVKGMAATMGYEQTARLAHHLEDCLDDFRQAGTAPAPAIELLFRAVDLLEGLIDDIEAGRAERDVSGFLESQEGPAHAAGVEQRQGEETGSTPVDIPLLDLENLVQDQSPMSGAASELVMPELTTAGDQAISPEPETFQIRIFLAEGAAVPAARGLLLLRELEERGEIIAVEPDKQALLAGAPCGHLNAWFRSVLGQSHIKECLLAFADVAKVEIAPDRRRGGQQAKAGGGSRSVRVRTDLLDRFVSLAGELLTHRHVLQMATRERDWAGMQVALDQTSRLVDDLHHHVLRTRLVPLESIAGRLPRLVRDLGRKTGKQVTFRLIGGDVGLDRVILDELADPLVHLVRNAVDHGICSQGEVLVSAHRERDLVLVEVRDDGLGMDPARLRQKAVERGMLNQVQAEALSDRDALMLICRPGFSTAATVTETSGRGVGMDVVKSAVENLGGTLSIQSAPDEGACFQLRLPVSVAIVKLVLVRCAGLPLALPVTRVQRVIEVPRQELQQADGQVYVRLNEEKVRLEILATALGLQAPPLDETVCIVLAERQGTLTGLLVDGFIGHRDAFVKNLGFPLNLLDGLSGATIEGDGSVLFIVDPQILLADKPIESVA